MTAWVVAGVILVLVFRFLWKAYTHPAHVLARQAAHMNWTAAGTDRDTDGYRNTRVSRGPYEAVISYKAGNVQLLKPAYSQTFKDFVEVERWLSTRGPSSATSGHVDYFQRIEAYITAMGWYDRLLTIQGTDPQFCEATLRVYRSGFSADQPDKVVGALIIEAVNKYSSNRDFAMHFLQALEAQFLARADE